MTQPSFILRLLVLKLLLEKLLVVITEELNLSVSIVPLVIFDALKLGMHAAAIVLLPLILTLVKLAEPSPLILTGYVALPELESVI